MHADQLNQWCEAGAQQLMRTEYLDAITTLQRAEELAWTARDWDTLARLYLPLQEAHRQARQRCGEGAVAYDVFVGPGGFATAADVLTAYPMGQLLVSGDATVQPAVELRHLARQRRIYVDAFLGARYPLDDGRMMIAVVPLATATLPDATPRPEAELRRLLPLNSLVFDAAALPPNASRGTAATYAQSIMLWERLHGLFLSRADAEPDPTQRMTMYREVLRVDPACELAHQKLAAVAREMGRAEFR